PCERTAGTGAGDEGGQLTAGLRQDLRAGLQLVRLRIPWVGELVDVVPAGQISGDPASGVNEARWAGRWDLIRAAHDLRAPGAHHRLLLWAHFRAHRNDQWIPTGRRRSESQAGVASSRLNNRANSGLQETGLFCAGDDVAADAVLHRP